LSERLVFTSQFILLPAMHGKNVIISDNIIIIFFY
jgi:hypothetical protein